MKASSRTLWASVLFFFWSNASAQEVVNYVKVVGAMKEVMWKGKLSGTIDLDTLSNKQHLFGLGPVEYLAGEILIIDGKAYRSTVLTDSTMKVEETFHYEGRRNLCDKSPIFCVRKYYELDTSNPTRQYSVCSTVGAIS